ncbi:hypothetical protein MASR1M31_03610 [Porphyromonadaceae bacterium]
MSENSLWGGCAKKRNKQADVLACLLLTIVTNVRFYMVKLFIEGDAFRLDKTERHGKDYRHDQCPPTVDGEE